MKDSLPSLLMQAIDLRFNSKYSRQSRFRTHKVFFAQTIPNILRKLDSQSVPEKKLKQKYFFLKILS